MAQEARHHHYIPKCYLRGFATGSGKKARVTVAALKARNFFETNPRNIGGIRDFLRIEAEGQAPDVLEKAMARFEAEVAIALRTVNESQRFEGNERILILNLIALLSVRSPQQRENWRPFQENVAKQVMDLALASRERWEGQMRQMKKAGWELNDNITYEQLKDFHERGEYEIAVNQEWHIGLELKGFDVVLRTLVHRKWRLYATTEETGWFVTSDRPVVLTWNHPEKIPVMMRKSPGFGATDTEVYFPLSHKIALVGVFEDVGEGTYEASFELVAKANVRMILAAFEQVYTIKKTFPYIGPDRAAYYDQHFMERFEAAREQTVNVEANGSP